MALTSSQLLDQVKQSIDEVTADQVKRGLQAGEIQHIVDVRERDVRLLLNLSDVQVKRSWVEVEVLPADGDQPLAGFGRDDCLPLHRDGLREQVVWRDRRLADLDQTQIRLRFNLFGAARLHSFTFAA